ncbi:MAG TPA: calcium-binding protein [Acetobacteraceae bacterium]|nr:calcium-binding protein [Acetobacteraceae bacterium]
MPSVSVSSGSSFLQIAFPSGSDAALAQQLADTLLAPSQNGTETFQLVSANDIPIAPVPGGNVGVLAIVETQAPFTAPLAVPADFSFTVIDTSDGFASVQGNGGEDQRVLISSATGVAFNTGGGSGTVVAGQGSNLIGTPTAGGGNQLIVGGTGNETVTSFTGDNVISPGGGANLVGLENGSDTVSLSGTADTVVAATGDDTVSVTGEDAALIFGGTGRLTFINGSAPSTVVGGSGSETITGGAGGGLYQGGSGGENSISGGSGRVTIFGGGSGDTLAAGGSLGNALVAASGNETLTSAGSHGLDSMYGGSGQDVMIAGLGGDIMLGGSGTANFEFIKGLTSAGSTYDVFNDHAGDVVTLSGYSGAPTETSAGGNTVLSLSDGTRITFVGVAHGSLLNIQT